MLSFSAAHFIPSDIVWVVWQELEISSITSRRFSCFCNAVGWGFSAWTEKRLEARCKSQLLGLEKDMCKLERRCKLETLTLVNRCSIHEGFPPVWFCMMNIDELYLHWWRIFLWCLIPADSLGGVGDAFISWFLLFTYMFLHVFWPILNFCSGDWWFYCNMVVWRAGSAQA